MKNFLYYSHIHETLFYRKQFFFFLQNLHKMHINIIKYCLSLENCVQNIQNLK